MLLLGRYHDQIASLETKIPPHEVNIPFKWKDAFHKGGLFVERASLSKPFILNLVKNLHSVSPRNIMKVLLIVFYSCVIVGLRTCVCIV